MAAPRVSIITPVYNAGPYLIDAVRSVLEQTIACWELLIIDDGSTDSPRDRIRTCLEDPRITFVRQDNQGVSVARNVGLARARGEWVGFLDADDALTPRSLQCRMELLEKHPQLAFIDGRVDTFDVSLQTLRTSWTPSFNGMPFETLLFETDRCFWGPSWLVRNTGTVKPFKVGMTHGEDLFFFLENATRGEYSFVSETVLRYRKGHRSAMHNLRGLEDGYRTLYREIKGTVPGLSAGQLEILRKKYISIMRKSYLRRGALGSALRVSRRFSTL